MKSEEYMENVKCIKSETATHSCLNKKCKKYAFLCSRQQCQCHQDHEDCPIIKIKSILKNTRDKIISIQNLRDFIEQSIEKLVDKLSTFREEIIVELNKRFQFLGLNQNQKLFLNNLKLGHTEQITGSKIWQLQLGSQKQCFIPVQIQMIIGKINSTLLSFQRQFQKSIEKTNNYIKQFQRYSTNAVQKVQKIIVTKCQRSQKYSTLFQFFLAFSKIIHKPQQIKNLWQFFLPKKIKSFKMIYRASTSDFKISSFHQKCDNKPNTLIVCETEFGKKIGGYTSIPWERASQKKYLEDQLGDSFIFSLTNNDKFILQQKKKAIYHCHFTQNYYRNPYNSQKYSHSNEILAFGSGHDFMISHQSNNKSISYSNINNSYMNYKYKNNDKESYRRFTGSPQGQKNFKIKQWEVWQIQFEK